MNRVEIKTKAKEILKENFKGFWKGYIIIFGISFLCSLVLGIIAKPGSILYQALNLVITFFLSTLNVGFILYILKMVRKEEYSNEDIFKFVKNVLPIVAITILMTIFVFLWSLLLIIPGIIAALGYSMVFYIYADKHVENESKSPMEYLSESKKLMNGYKLDYFVFGLSFIGWILLSAVTFGIGLIYTIPYITIAEALYYEELKKKHKTE